MSKGLEALKRIRQETCPATYMSDFDKNECCDIIEKELKEYEVLQGVLDDFGVYNVMNLIDTLKNIQFLEKQNAFKRLEELEEEKQSFDRVIEKKLKALKIIKNKQVNVSHLNANLDTYNYYFASDDNRLTEEEYDLLKEVLL